MRERRYFSTGQAGNMIGLADRTIRRKCVDGLIPGAIRTDAGYWRVPAAWVYAVIAQDVAVIVDRPPPDPKRP